MPPSPRHGGGRAPSGDGPSDPDAAAAAGFEASTVPAHHWKGELRRSSRSSNRGETGVLAGKLRGRLMRRNCGCRRKAATRRR